AGAEPPADIDGISMLPAFQGKPQQDHEYLYWEIAMEDGFMQAARKGDWKAVRQSLDQPIELYDLSKDLAEETNVAQEHPEIVAEMKRIFEKAHTESEEYPMKPRSEWSS